MPAVGPLGTGVATACQLRPASRVLKTRVADPPPVANQARPADPGQPAPSPACSSTPRSAGLAAVTRQVPLAAKANSPVRAGGIRSAGTPRQDRPPSDVDAIRKRPSTGSDSASPRRL